MQRLHCQPKILLPCLLSQADKAENPNPNSGSRPPQPLETRPIGTARCLHASYKSLPISHSSLDTTFQPIMHTMACLSCLAYQTQLHVETRSHSLVRLAPGGQYPPKSPFSSRLMLWITFTPRDSYHGDYQQLLCAAATGSAIPSSTPIRSANYPLSSSTWTPSSRQPPIRRNACDFSDIGCPRELPATDVCNSQSRSVAGIWLSAWEEPVAEQHIPSTTQCSANPSLHFRLRNAITAYAADV